MKDRGSASLEATLVMPIFILAMIALFHMGRAKMAEAVVYEAISESSEYLAESAYINKTKIVVPAAVISDYIDDKGLVEEYIKGGVSGISFLGTYITDDGELVVKARFTINFFLPFMEEFSTTRKVTITQKAYVGYKDFDDGEDDGMSDTYVYVTENQDVYHSTRSCTHLNLSIKSTTMEGATKNGYSSCEFCGSSASAHVFITDYGDRYHSNINCSGLKRTIRRVKLTEVGGLAGCSRCVN